MPKYVVQLNKSQINLCSVNGPGIPCSSLPFLKESSKSQALVVIEEFYLISPGVIRGAGGGNVGGAFWDSPVGETETNAGKFWLHQTHSPRKESNLFPEVAAPIWCAVCYVWLIESSTDQIPWIIQFLCVYSCFTNLSIPYARPITDLAPDSMLSLEGVVLPERIKTQLIISYKQKEMVDVNRERVESMPHGTEYTNNGVGE